MAKSKIAGITLEIGGNTTKLSKALQEPNKEAKELQSKLRAVEQALKFDPKNTDLLQQKMRLTEKTVQNVEEKLKLLKQAQDQYVASGKDIDSAEYIELQRQIALTENKMKELKSTQDTISKSFEKFGNSVQNVGSKIEDVGKKSTVISAGVVGIGAASHKAWSELDESFDNIAKGTGATGDALENLQKDFKVVFSTFPADAQDVSTAIADINTRFAFTDKKLQDASISFLKFAEVNNVDVSSAISLVARAMGDAGIESSHYEEILDSLTAASQASGISINTLTEMITKYGAPMRALGYTTQESIAIFSSWEKAGVNTEIAFSGMKKAISNFTKNGKDAKAEFKNLVEGIKNGSISAQEALEIFGAKAGPDLIDAIKGGRFEFEDMLKVVENSSGQMSQTFEDTLDPIDRAKVSMNNLKIAGAQLGDTIQTTIAPVIDKITKKIQQFTTWFGTLNQGTQEMIVVIGLIAAAVGPILILIGKIVSSVGILISTVPKIMSGIDLIKNKISMFTPFVKTAIDMIKTGLSGLFGLIMSHPVIAVVTAIIGAVVVLYNKCEWFRNAVNSILTSIKDFIISSVQSVKVFIFETIPQTIDSVVNWFKELPGKIWTTLLDVINKIKVWGQRLFAAGADAGWNLLTSVVNSITSLPTRLWNIATTAVLRLSSGIRSKVGNAINAIKYIGTEIWNGISSLPSKMSNIGSNIVRGIFDGIQDMTGWITDKIGGFTDSVVDSIKSFFGIHSPSRVMKELIGKNLVAGIGVGIESNEKLATDPLNKLGKNILNSSDDIISTTPFFNLKSVGNKLANMYSYVQKIKNKMKDSINSDVNFSAFSEIKKVLEFCSTITIVTPVSVDLDGQPIYRNVVKRITKNQNSHLMFKGG